MAHVLVLYGTTDGHTAKIAESVAGTLRETGITVDVAEAKRGLRAEEYDAVIVAASVHGGKYQRGVRAWARANAAALNRRPSAFISVCLGVLQREEERVQQEVRAIMARFLSASEWRPVLTTTVAGALLYTQYNPLMRWIMRRIAGRAGGDTDTSRDYVYTDWAALRAFVEDFAAGLRRGEAGHPASPLTSPHVA